MGRGREGRVRERQRREGEEGKGGEGIVSPSPDPSFKILKQPLENCGRI